MDEKKIFSNLNSSNKNTDEIINKIQNSLNRLQSAINNKQLLDNFNNDKTNIQNKNINFRKRTIDNIKISRKNKPSYTEEKIQNIIYDNNSMFNINSVMNTDKRSTQKKMIQNRVLNTLNYDDDIINRTMENIIPKSTQRRNYYNKINYYNYNRNNYTNNGLSRKACFKCRNINPPNSKFCFNCGAPVTNTIRNQYNTDNIKSNIKNNISNKGSSRNIENLEENQNYPRTQIQSNNNYNKPKNNKIMNNIYEDLNDIQNENLINYKKLNDLYLFGDYLENELKVSNDENVKLLEQYKKMKIQVHSLNQKNNKIKQNISTIDKEKKKYFINKKLLKRIMIVIEIFFGFLLCTCSILLIIILIQEKISHQKIIGVIFEPLIIIISFTGMLPISNITFKKIKCALYIWESALLVPMSFYVKSSINDKYYFFFDLVINIRIGLLVVQIVNYVISLVFKIDI